MKTLPVGFSPCPNDTFLFYGMVAGRVDTEGYRFEPVIEDVETLNRWALENRLPMTKASYGVLGRVGKSYWCLRSGGALGHGCGPLLVARPDGTLARAAAGRVAIPGIHTTANALLGMRLGGGVERVPMLFHEIMPAVARGEVDAGVIIHESRFTYPQRGLIALEDLGEWWERQTGLPIPLGGILLQRDTPGVDPATVQRVVRRSVEFGLANPEAPMIYVRAHAQELEDAVVEQHIGLYVNGYSVDVGLHGEQAVRVFLERSAGFTGGRPHEGELFP